jgi:hypothetical protein
VRSVTHPMKVGRVSRVAGAGIVRGRKNPLDHYDPRDALPLSSLPIGRQSDEVTALSRASRSARRPSPIM